MACNCSSYSPPIKVTAEQLAEINLHQEFRLSKTEAEMLYEYFMRAGYIGYELEHDLVTHKIIDKLALHLGKVKKFGTRK